MTRSTPAFQAVPPASESQSTAEQKAPEPQDPGQAPPPDQGLFGGPMMMFLMFVPLILLLFWQSRSQQKKQENAIKALKKGDRVLTQSGLIGRLLEIDNRYAKLELAPAVRVQVLRSSLAGRDQEDAAADKSSDTGKETSKKDDK